MKKKLSELYNHIVNDEERDVRPRDGGSTITDNFTQVNCLPLHNMLTLYYYGQFTRNRARCDRIQSNISIHFFPCGTLISTLGLVLDVNKIISQVMVRNVSAYRKSTKFHCFKIKNSYQLMTS